MNTNPYTEHIRFCVKKNAGVGKKVENKEWFYSIFKTKSIDYYICDHAIYQICDGGEIFFVDKLKMGKRGAYVINPNTGSKVSLNNLNFAIMCTKSDNKACPEAWVQEYIPPEPKQKEDTPEELPTKKMGCE